jgi:transcriptional antiterminator NusG
MKDDELKKKQEEEDLKEKSDQQELEELKQTFLRIDEGYSWYFLNVLSTQEQVVKERIEKYIEDNHLEEDILKILLPEVTYYEINKGIRDEKKRKLFPAYLLIKMRSITNSEDGETQNLNIWHEVRSINGVIDFIGTKNGHIPFPVSSAELLKIFNVKKESKNKRTYRFSSGNKVKVIEGPFKDFTGEIAEVDEDKLQLKVMISVFGRQTPVTIAFEEVENI